MTKARLHVMFCMTVAGCHTTKHLQADILNYSTESSSAQEVQIFLLNPEEKVIGSAIYEGVGSTLRGTCSVNTGLATGGGHG